MFVRLTEIIEAARLKINNKVKISEAIMKDDWENVYD